MNTEVIVEVARATVAGTIAFPEVGGKLMGAGGEYYHVDYVVMRRRLFYGAGGDAVVTPITYEGMPAVAAELSLEGLRAAILDSQRNNQKYRDFTRRAMAAGVQGGLRRVFTWETGCLYGPDGGFAHRMVFRCGGRQVK